MWTDIPDRDLEPPDGLLNGYDKYMEEARMDTVIATLDRLANLYAQIDAENMDYDAKRDEILAPVQAQLDELESARAEEIGELRFEASTLEAAIKQEVVGIGESVKGTHLQAVYSKPRVTWDTKKLDGYAAAHPEIEPFRKVGEPSVSIRVVK